MDYDDNDFQSQNFQLAGEDSSKFPSVLRSFALPSFDLDDHLQVHLRFDSLVEPGSLLGIPGQEENNWIESFSTGGSAIEFSSNAAESCSISRNNNVWSEATSSESVEMLLKSVGEDDMMENKTINEQPDSDNVLNSLSNTTTSLTTIVPVDSKMESPRDADSATLPEKSHHSLPEIREDIVNAFSTVGGGHQTSIDEKPLSESSLDLVGCPPDDVHNTETVICLSATSLEEHKDQEEPLIDRKCLDRALEENSLDHLNFASHASDDPLISDLSKTTSDTAHLNVQIDVGSSPAMSIMKVVASEHSSARKSTNYISQEYGKVLPYETSSMLPYRQKVENQSLHSAVQIDEGNAIGSCIGASENPSGSEEQKLEDPSIVLMEGFNELAYSRKSDGLLEVIVDQVKLASKGDEVRSQILTESKDKPFAMLDDVNNLKVDSDESNKEDISRPSSLLHEVNTTAKVVKADVAGFHKGSTELVQEVDTAMVVMEEKLELGHCQSENSSDKVAVPKEKCHISSGEADEKQASETMEEKKASDQESSVEALMDKSPDNILNSEGITNQPEELHYENVYPLETVMLELQTSSATGGSTKSCHIDSMVAESCDIRVSSSGATIIKKCPSVSPSPANPVSDCSLVTGMTQDSLVQAKDTSSATAHDESFKREIVQEELDITDSSPNLTRSVPSGKSEHTHKLHSEDTCVSDEFAVDIQSESSRLPSSKAILSHKSSQFSSGACNLQTASLHVCISDSEYNVLSTSGQLASIKTTKSSELQNSASVKVAVIPQNEFPPSTEKRTTLGCAIDGKGHPTVGAEVKEKGEYEEPTSRISGDTLHLKDNSIECDTSSKVDESLSVEAGNTNLSEHSCGSPNIISLVRHSHDERDGQEKKGSADHIQTTSDDRHCITNTEKSSCETESTGGNPKESNAFADDKSFTFKVGQLPEHSEENATKGWKPFSSPQFSEAPQSLPLTSAKSVYDQCKSTEPRDISQLVSHEGESHDIGTKSAGVEKTRSSATVTVSRRKTKEKSISKKIAEKRENPSSTLASSFGTINRDLQLEGVRKHLPAEGTSMKSSSSLTVQASNLPDLNSSTTALFNQPFTDSQQVQLRAQIFVYGSLIQGIPPDEACMVSAFGDVDGGRGRWEGVWRAVAEKYDNQKSPLAGCETPSRPVVKVPDQALRSSSLQSKVISAPTSRTGNKGPATTSFSPVSLPSPVWSVSTRDKLQTNASRGSHLEPSPMLSTLQPFQPQHVRQYSGNSTPWLTPSPCAVPWVAPSQTSTLDTSSKVSILPISETVQFTPPRDSSVSHGSNIQFLSPASALPATGYVSASTASAMLVDASKEVVSGRKKHASADQKSRRRKRGTVPDAIVQMLPVSEPQLQLEPATGASKLTCSSTHADTSGRASSGGLISTIAPIISPTHFQVVGTGRTEPNIIFSEETYGKIEQAKLQAEDAAAFAAVAVRHSEGIWNQLATQKSSGIVSEVEQKLASAAVAAAAAAAVAKAASAAAKLSADSAVQAKLMADEAMMLGKTGRAPQSSESAGQYGGDNLSRVTPASILKGKEKSNGSYSIIPAAREAARRRLEAASAATKRAENLDAIVKAAELAAEAVSQAGSIVAMGEPLPLSLSTILEGGPEGYWRAQHSKGELLVKTNITCGEKQSAFKQLSFNDKGRQETAAGEIVHSSTDLPRQSIENQTGDVSGIASPTILVGEDGKDHSVVDLSENVIQEGSLVEVLSDVKGPGGVWYSARVLNLKDSKAFVCYNELLNDEGSDKIKEWISLDHEDDRAPRIRAAHPIAAKKSEGPRKRRRAAAGMHSWNIGDRVDAWINEGWREGVITEKSEEDLTKFIVHFPAGGDTSVVRSWDLRPSLVWREGQWIELSHSQKSISEHHEGDTPVQKRRKISRPEAKINSQVQAQALGVSRVSRNLRSDDSRKPQDFVPLPLSAKEKDFSLGKAREENNSDRVKRTGLQKEGSRVVFGIPKPGKKRKFMDVSKHCVVVNTEKTREASESVKFAKYLMPQPSTGWKNVPKVDARSKRSVDLKPKVFKSAKSRNVQTRSLADKGNLSIPILSSSNGEGNSRGTLTSSKPSYSHVDSRLEKKNVPEVGLYANKMGMVEGPVSVSHLHSTPDVPFVNKSTFDAEAEKGKDSHAMENSTTNEERCSNFSGKVIPDATEPRRSNRRIQPTSRLLEGLQSSLIVTKIPSVSHDKSSKVSHRTVSSSRGHTRS